MLDFGSHEYSWFGTMGYEISEPKPLYHDPMGEWLAYTTVVREKGRYFPFFHLKVKDGKALTAQQMKRFIRAIPEMQALIGMPILTSFEMDNERRHRFALRFGWKLVSTLPCTDGVERRIYRYPYRCLVYDAATQKVILKTIE